VANRVNGLAVLVVDDEPLARRRVVRLLRQLSWVGAVEEAGNVRQAREKLAGFDPRILLLDIQMPGGSGFDLVRHLEDPAPALVFITAFDDQALRAFDANAVDYVTKPIEPGRFHAALERARTSAERQSSADRIVELEEVVASLRRRPEAQAPRAAEFWVKAKGDYIRIASAAITRIQAERDYVRIHADGQDYLYSENLATIERSLPPDEFVRIHRSTIVRVDAIERMKAGSFSSLIAVLSDGSEVRVGRTYTAGIRARLMRQD
jgi:DNA-binding LytR/AlgR family response regulator